MSRPPVRAATLDDLATLVHHRRRMWEDLDEGFTEAELDDADRAYRAWARPKLKNGKLAAFLTETPRGDPIASGCVWLQPIQPRPRAAKLQPYILSMYTEPAHRGEGHAARIVRACVAWATERGYPRVALHAAPLGRGVYAKEGFERTWEMLRRR